MDFMRLNIHYSLISYFISFNDKGIALDENSILLRLRYGE